MMKLKLTMPVLLVLACLLCRQSRAGDANYDHYFGARTLALNGLYLAGVDGLSSTFNNPAAGAFLKGSGMDISLMAKIGDYSFKNNERGLFNSFRNEDLLLGIGGYWQPAANWTLTLAYLPVIDYRIDWPYAMVLGSEANQVVLTFDMNNQISVRSISFNVAHNLGNLALGVALNLYQVAQKMNFPLATPDWDPNSIVSGAYQFTYSQDAAAFGINFGASMDLSDDLKLAVMVRSAFTAELSGEAQSRMFYDLARADTAFSGALPPTTVDISSNFDYPWTAGVGLLWK
jgi:hypothetical protein